MQTLPEHGHQLRLLQASVLFLIFCEGGVISKGILNLVQSSKKLTYHKGPK